MLPQTVGMQHNKYAMVKLEVSYFRVSVNWVSIVY
jgi:hypothetical protein